MIEYLERYVEAELSEKATKIFDGVDGRKVTDLEQQLHPRRENRPEKFNKLKIIPFCYFHLLIQRIGASISSLD